MKQRREAKIVEKVLLEPLLGKHYDYDHGYKDHGERLEWY